jgi:hypothetical protein
MKKLEENLKPATFEKYVFLAGYKKGIEVGEARRRRFCWVDALGFGFWAFVFLNAGVYIGINLR